MTKTRNLIELLNQGPVICAEGYLFEMERRGYLQAGAFVPEVVLENPQALTQLHRDFLHAGSDVMEAFTYYAHREKLKVIGRENDLELINRTAIQIARKVADEGDALVAGNICNTNIFNPDEPATAVEVRKIFEEQIEWAVDEGVDYFVAETFSYLEEALIALDCIKATGLPSVIMFAIHQFILRDEPDLAKAAKVMEQAGADVVGLNCATGPKTMLPILKQMRAAVDIHIAGLPVPYRTTEKENSFQSLTDPKCDCIPNNRPFPVALDALTCNRYEIAEFAKECLDNKIHYQGVCCGAGPHHIRAMAEALGKNPPASKYSVDMSKHAFFGTDKKIKKHYQDIIKEMV